MDFSNSMWGDVQGRKKYLSAGDATQELLDVLTKLSSESGVGQEVGLMLYGHTTSVTRRNCSDIEVVVSPSPVADAAHRRSIMGAVRRAQPRGMTPISASLKQAAEGLKYRERPATLILVSDGLETCEADPCADARRLHAQGVRFIAHIVGYDVNLREFERLKCIADVTGGMAVRATDASELTTGMRHFADAIMRDAQERASGSLAIEVVDSNGRPLAATDFDTAPELRVETSGESPRRLPLTGETQSLKLLAANYRVRLQGDQEYAAADVEIVAGRTLSARLQVRDGHLETVFRPAMGVPAFSAAEVSWRVLRGDQQVAANSAVNPATFTLAPGRYAVSARMGLFAGTGETRILPDGSTRLEVMPDPPFTELKVGLVQPAPTLFAATEVPRRLRVIVETPAGDVELARGSDTLTVHVPPGKVRVPWVAGDRSGAMQISVPPAGLAHSEMLSLPSVDWTVEWAGDPVPEPFVWTIEALLDGQPTGAREVRTGDSAISGTIPPGTYRVTVTRGSVATTDEITVPSEGSVEKRFYLRERL